MHRIHAFPFAGRVFGGSAGPARHAIGAIALLLALFRGPAALGAGPAPTEDAVAMREGAWLGTCDNSLDCTLFGFAEDDSAVLMVRLPRAGPGDGRLLLRPDRPLRADSLHLQFGRRGAVLVVRMAAVAQGRDQLRNGAQTQPRATIDAAVTRALLVQLRQTGRPLLLSAAAHADIRPVALASIRPAGASAVLDWIGRVQRRVPVAASPIGRAPTADPSWAPPTAALPAMVAALPSVRACARQDSGQPGQGPSGTTLSRRVVLWRVPCGSDNFSQDSLFVLAEGTRAAPARFDSPPQFPTRPPGILVNAEMVDAGVLSATEPARGLEDCGDVRRYRWDGSRFRLAQAQLMPACHGLAVEDWPVVYRAGGG